VNLLSKCALALRVCEWFLCTIRGGNGRWLEKLLLAGTVVLASSPVTAQSLPPGHTPNWTATAESDVPSPARSPLRNTTTPEKKYYDNTSLTACPAGEKFLYFLNKWSAVGDRPDARGASWCAAASTVVAIANASDTVLWRLPYLMEGCTEGVSWRYSHSYQNGTRYYSPPYRSISLVCEVQNLEISVAGPTQARPMDDGGQVLRLVATVTRNGVPQPGVQVRAAVQAGAGGTVIPSSAITDAGGAAVLDYTPPQSLVGATKADQIRMDCDGCLVSANMAISVQGTPVLPATPQTCPASPGQETGHPILPASGTKVLRHTDWQDDAPHGLSLTRHFASRWSVGPAAGLGATWSHNHAHRVIGAGALAPASRMVAFGDGQVSPFINTGTVAYVDPNAGGIWQCPANTWCAPTQPVVDPNLYPPVWTATGSLDTMTDTPQGILVNRASDDSQWLFDRLSGLVLSHRQRNGWVYQFSYSNGRLTQVSNSFGRNLQFAYDAQGRLSSATAPDGTVIRYTFDSASRLIGAAYADNSSKSYLYENTSWPQAVTGVVDEQGNRFASFAYDAQGRAISSELADGADRVQVTYAAGRSSVKDAFGVTRTYEYQPLRGRARGMDTTQASALGADGNAVASQSFNADSLLQSQTDFLGITTLFTWDAARRLKLAETRAANRPEAQTVQTEWHPTLRLPVLVTEAGRSTAYTYDALGNKLSEVVTDLATGQTRSQSWAYNAQGLVASTTDARGGSWTFAYDAQGNRTRQRNPLGHETQWQHDAAGRLTQQTEPNGLVTTFIWDARGRLTQANRGGEVTAYIYTPAGLLASAALPNGHAISYQYDAAQRLTAATDNRGNSVKYTLDGMGNRVREEVKDANGAIALVTSRVINHLNRVAAIQGAVGQTTALGYDANGEPVSQTDPLNQTTRQALDGLRRPTATTFADNTAASQAWNALDQLTQVTDPKGVATQYTRNAFGEVLSETSPDTGTTAYQRDAAGDVVAMTDARGITTRITRDALGRPVQASRGAAHQTVYTWDTQQTGYLAKVEDASGSTAWERDAQGRVLRKTQRVNDNPANPASFITAYSYAGGELASITYPSGLTVHYQRNAAGQISGINTQLPGRNRPVTPFITSLTHTALGQPKAWAWASGDSASRSFDADGRMVSNEFASYQYDAASRITAITQNLWASRTVTSVVGTGTVTVTELYQTPLNWSAGYDNRNRLTSFSRAGSDVQYTYDANSNRLTAVNKTISDTDLDGEFDASDFTRTTRQSLNIDGTSNRLLGFTQSLLTQTTNARGVFRTVSNVVTPVTYSLDDAGNLTSDGLRNFDYDEANRLSKVRVLRDGEQASIRYLHNALGQRVFKGEPQAEQTLPSEAQLGTDFITWLKKQFGWLFAQAQANTSIGTAYTFADGPIPGWAILGEYDNGSAKGAGRSEYIWLPTKDGAIPVGMFRNGKLFAIHSDHLGTPRLMTTEANQPVWQWPYSAFGDNKPTGVLRATPNPKAAITNIPVLLKATAATELNLRFPGQYDDAETGTFYNYQRQYLASQGRYTQGDPIGLEGGLNRFSYVSGDPLSAVDPMGLDAIFVHYMGYSVGLPGGVSAPIGHSGAIAVDPMTGETRYYEFGRYGGKCGNVRGPFNVGKIDFDKNGNPTRASIEAALRAASKAFGKNSPTHHEYSRRSFSDVVAYAERRKREAETCERPYNFVFDNCNNFGREAAGR
jgi:RHS repeat-associated protein